MSNYVYCWRQLRWWPFQYQQQTQIQRPKTNILLPWSLVYPFSPICHCLPINFTGYFPIKALSPLQDWTPLPSPPSPFQRTPPSAAVNRGTRPKLKLSEVIIARSSGRRACLGVSEGTVYGAPLINSTVWTLACHTPILTGAESFRVNGNIGHTASFMASSPR